MPVDVEYVLTFGNTTVGTRLHAFGAPEIVLATEPKVIHPFWWKNVIIDGRYPAPVYTWPFQVSLISADQMHYQDDYHSLDWMIEAALAGPTQGHTINVCPIIETFQVDAGTVTVAGTPTMSFGKCMFAGSKHVEPSDVLVTSMGIVEVRFMGAVRPVLLTQ